MFYVDFANVVLRDLDEIIRSTTETVWHVQDYTALCESRARRNALMEARRIITERLGNIEGESL